MGRYVAALLVPLLASAALAQDGPGLEMPRAKVGEVHPDVRLPTIDSGEGLRLSDLRGEKVLLLEFASW